MKSRLLAAAGALTLAAAATVLTAPVASADQIWYQGVGRATAEAACPANTAADNEAGWTEWTASWEDWPNNGAGGYVCTRQNTWALESTGDGGGRSGCVRANDIPEYVYFGSGWKVTAGEAFYPDPQCSATPLGYSGFNLVWAPDGAGQASARCQQAFGTSNTWQHLEWNRSIYACVI